MTCTECDSLLLEYAYRELAPETAREVETHLPGCARCTQALAEIQQTLSAVRSLPPEQPSDRGVDSLLAYAEQAARRHREQAHDPERGAGFLPVWLSRLLFRPGFAVAAVVVVVAVATISMTKLFGGGQDQMPGAAEHPVATGEAERRAPAAPAPAAAPAAVAPRAVAADPARSESLKLADAKKEEASAEGRALAKAPDERIEAKAADDGWDRGDRAGGGGRIERFSKSEDSTLGEAEGTGRGELAGASTGSSIGGGGLKDSLAGDGTRAAGRSQGGMPSGSSGVGGAFPAVAPTPSPAAQPLAKGGATHWAPAPGGGYVPGEPAPGTEDARQVQEAQAYLEAAPHEAKRSGKDERSEFRSKARRSVAEQPSAHLSRGPLASAPAAGQGAGAGKRAGADAPADVGAVAQAASPPVATATPAPDASPAPPPAKAEKTAKLAPAPEPAAKPAPRPTSVAKAPAAPGGGVARARPESDLDDLLDRESSADKRGGKRDEAKDSSRAGEELGSGDAGEKKAERKPLAPAKAGKAKESDPRVARANERMSNAYTDAEQAEALYQAAEQAYRASRRDEALKLFMKVADEFPNDPRAPKALLAALQLEWDRGNAAGARSIRDRMEARYAGSASYNSAQRFMAEKNASEKYKAKAARRTYDFAEEAAPPPAAAPASEAPAYAR